MTRLFVLWPGNDHVIRCPEVVHQRASGFTIHSDAAIARSASERWQGVLCRSAQCYRHALISWCSITSIDCLIVGLAIQKSTPTQMITQMFSLRSMAARPLQEKNLLLGNLWPNIRVDTVPFSNVPMLRTSQPGSTGCPSKMACCDRLLYFARSIRKHATNQHFLTLGGSGRKSFADKYTGIRRLLTVP